MRIAWDHLDEIGESLRGAVHAQLERITTADEALTSVQLGRVSAPGTPADEVEVRVTATLGKRKLVVARKANTAERAVMLAVAALEATLRRLLTATPRVAEPAAPARQSAAALSPGRAVQAQARAAAAVSRVAQGAPSGAVLLESVSRGWQSARQALRPEWLGRLSSNLSGALVRAPSVEVLPDRQAPRGRPGKTADDLVETRTLVETTVVETRRMVVETRQRSRPEEGPSRAVQRLFEGEPRTLEVSERPAPARTRVRARLTRPPRTRRRGLAWALPRVGVAGIAAAGLAVWLSQDGEPAFTAVAMRGAGLPPVAGGAGSDPAFFSSVAEPSSFGATAGGSLAPVRRPADVQTPPEARSSPPRSDPPRARSAEGPTLVALSPASPEAPVFWAISAAE